MGMGVISIAVSFNEKKLSYYTNFYYLGVMKKEEKYEIEMTKIDQQCYLFRQFSHRQLVGDG